MRCETFESSSPGTELRLRKISESILDEFPNIGERRKAALLKKFGSVQRRRLASIEQIAKVRICSRIKLFPHQTIAFA